MANFIDRRLMDKITDASSFEQVEAILIFKDEEVVGLSVDDGGLAQQVVEGLIKRTGDLPKSVRYFPRANAAVISSSSWFIQEILKDKHLAVASATDIDFVKFFP